MTLTHEKLVAWQRADDLFIAIHALASRLPEIERFALASQMRRAAYSVPANIVEGMARRSLADRARFLNIAEASLAEVITAFTFVGACSISAKRIAGATSRWPCRLAHHSQV